MKRKSLLALVVAPLFLFLSACGAAETDESQDDTGTTPTTEMATLKVGLIPVTAVAPIYIGIEQGFFEEEGIELDLVMGMGGPSAVAGVESGSVDIAIGDSAALIRAQESGLPLTALTSAGSVEGDGVGGSKVVVAEDSDIETAADLNGKTIGVFNLKSSNEMNVQAAIDAEGGDSSTVQYVNLEFPAMVAALQRGDIDAAGLAEPQLNQAVQNGDVRVTMDYYPIVFPDGTSITLWFTGSNQLEEKPDELKRFGAAMDKASAYADENPDAVRDIIPEFSGLSEEDVDDLPLQKYNMPLTIEDFEKNVEVMQEYGDLNNDPDLSNIIME